MPEHRELALRANARRIILHHQPLPIIRKSRPADAWSISSRSAKSYARKIGKILQPALAERGLAMIRRTTRRCRASSREIHSATQVVLNLASNAIKSTDRARSASRYRGSNGGARQDQRVDSASQSNEQLNRMFGASRKPTRRPPALRGTGLGLASARRCGTHAATIGVKQPSRHRLDFCSRCRSASLRKRRRGRAGRA